MSVKNDRPSSKRSIRQESESYRGLHGGDNLAVKVRAAGISAPDDAELSEVCHVALLAWDTNRDPAEVWREL